MTTPLKNRKIIQVIFLLENNLSYSFDVNNTITFHYLKRMISAAAHLAKNSFCIYNNNENYTDKDPQMLVDFFPNDQSIPFTLKINLFMPDLNESIVKLRLNEYCSLHSFKYLSYYCYTCKKSICSMCFQSNDHNSHNTIEKYDYLQSSKYLVENAFNDILDQSDCPKLNYLANIESLQSKLKNIHFAKLHSLLNDIEGKFNEMINFYNENTSKSIQIIQTNKSVIKDYCSSGLDKLKEEIGIERLMLNEEVFLTFDKKVKELSIFKDNLLFNTNLLSQFNSNYLLIDQVCEEVYGSLFDVLNRQLSLPIYNDIYQKLKEENVALITKDEIFSKMLDDVTIRTSVVPFNSKKTLHSQEKNVFFENLSDNRYSTLSPKEDKTETQSQNMFNPFSQHMKQELIISSDKKNQLNRPDCIMKPIPNSKELIILYQNLEGKKITVNFPLINSLTQFLEKSAYCNCNGNLYVSGGLTNKEINGSNLFLKYDPNYKTIILLPSMEIPRYNHTLISKEGIIYAVGGYMNNTVESFSISSFKWEKMNSMIIERQRPMLYFSNYFLYAFGGYSAKGYEKTVEKINVKNPKAKWEIVPYLNDPENELKFYGSGIVHVGNLLYFFGGRNDEGVLNKVHFFNLDHNTFGLSDEALEGNVFFVENTLYLMRDDFYCNIDEENHNPINLQINNN